LEREVKNALDAGGDGDGGLDLEELAWLLFNGNAEGEQVISVRLDPVVREAILRILHRQREERLKKAAEEAKLARERAELRAAQEEETRQTKELVEALNVIHSCVESWCGEGFKSYSRLRYSFDLFDEDKSGELEEEELTTIIQDYNKKHLKRSRGEKIILAEVKKALEAFDKDKSGGISWFEFLLIVASEGSDGGGLKLSFDQVPLTCSSSSITAPI